MSLTRETILNAKPKTKPIEVPEWGGTVYIRKLSIAAIQSLKEVGERVGGVQWLIVCLCDEHGNNLFTEADAEQLESDTSYETCLAIIHEAMAYNGLSKSAIEEQSGN